MLLAPTPYDQAADIILTLGTLTAEARERLGITAAEQADQIGIAPTTLTRLESGGEPMRPTIVAVLRWLSAN